MRIKKFITCLFVLSLSLLLPLETSGAADKDVESILATGKKTVAILYEGDKKFLKDEGQIIKDELSKLVKDRYELSFVEDDSGDFDEEKVRAAFRGFMSDEKVDAVVGLGFLVGLVVLEEKNLAKPVILADTYDVDAFEMPYSNGASGVKNLTYLAQRHLFRKEVMDFRQIVKFDKLHVLVDTELLEGIQNIIDLSAELKGIFALIEYKATAEETLEEIRSHRIEAVFYANSDRLYGDYRKKLISGVNSSGIPTFSNLGLDVVEQGVLAGMMPKFYGKFARRVALNLDRIFQGEKAEDLKVDFDIENRLVINARTARKIGLSIPYSILFDAKILHPYEEWGPQLTMRRAVEDALKNNLLFRIKDEEIRKAGEEHHLIWSNYLPQVKYSLQYDVYDSERARKGGGLYPKWQLTNRFTLNQLIFSDPLITDIANSRKQIFIERLGRESQEFDITDETSRAYLDYLIAKAIHRVNVDDMEATRHNLSVAEKRHKIGVGGREEVMRWQSILADRQAQVIKAESDIHKARVALNQLMNAPQESPFVEEDVNLEIMKYYLGGDEIKKFVKDAHKLDLFIGFNVEQGLEDSPELAALDLGIRQQEEIKGSAFKRFFLPEASLDGNINPSVRRKSYSAPAPDDEADWYVGLNMSYPIYEGGRRIFDLEKQKAELSRLIFKKELTEQFTEKSIRDAAYAMYFSFPNIRLTHQAMKSSIENYKIVEKKYSEGLVSITDLISAQNDRFTREAQAMISVYAFLQDLSSFDRAVSRFLFFASEEERKSWMEGLREYFSDRGVDIE